MTTNDKTSIATLIGTLQSDALADVADRHALFTRDVVGEVEASAMEIEPRTLEDDDAFTELLEATKRSVELAEDSARMASASEKRSRSMLLVGVATPLVALAALGFSIWSHFNPEMMPSEDASATTISAGSRNTQSGSSFAAQ